MLTGSHLCRAVLAAAAFATTALPSVAAADSPFVLLLCATYTGTAVIADPSSVHFSGTGRSTLLGTSDNDGQIVITGPDSSCAGGLANTNTETLTAANGDQLVLTLHDVSCRVGPNVFRGSGTWEVTHGTGRFHGAIGHGTSSGGADFNLGQFALTLDGTIALAGGGNS